VNDDDLNCFRAAKTRENRRHPSVGKKWWTSFPSLALSWARANANAAFEKGQGSLVEDEDQSDSDDDCLSERALIALAKQYVTVKAIDPEREITIKTWGNALLKQPPCAVNFSAACLSGKGHGINLKKMTGLNAEVQTRVAKCKMWPDWAEMVVAKIEKNDLKEIAVNCKKGRQAEELLRKCFYPRARMVHVTISG
jgi:hypothetical protein